MKKPKSLLPQSGSAVFPWNWKSSTHRVQGAQLGGEAISTSLLAGAVGLAAVILFMIAVYLLPGLAAGLALLIYTGLVLVLLNAFDITLSLPGIAGIILSIGMAVDANVIIFARGEGRNRVRKECAERAEERISQGTFRNH